MLQVMADGNVAQFAPPLELLNDQGGLFADMCSALGPKAVQDLRDLATEARDTKKAKQLVAMHEETAASAVRFGGDDDLDDVVLDMD
mmetsp:Transcript_8254/g.27048  ORF Transcript_8254/g.27048 Transcript_8254/m.27048 type:complete len:87 (+) Transcript_8254:45-305(+)